MTAKKHLPVQGPPIASYLFYLHPLSILTGHGEAHLPWLYSTFIQLVHFPGREVKFFLQPFVPSNPMRYVYGTTCPWLDVQLMNQEIVLGRVGEAPEFVMDCIERGRYVQLDVDFFHVPGRAEYRSRHFLHEILICGYDAGDEVFSVSGLTGRGQFGLSQVSFGELKRALSTPREELFPEEGTELPSWYRRMLAERPMVCLYRYVPEASFTLDPTVVAEWIGDYVEGRESARRFRSLATPKEEGRWGLQVYEYLDESLRHVMDGGSADLTIPLRVMWEHKKLMLARIEYLGERGIIDGSRCHAREYGEVEQRMGKARLLYLKWEGQRRDGQLERVRRLLAEVAEAERGVLTRLLEHMEPAHGYEG